MAAPRLERPTGRVTYWNDAKGYGWIRPFDITKPDYWFHASQRVEERSPRTNDAVSFALGADRDGREQATQVLLERE
jgi:cold shock CspA family protein